MASSGKTASTLVLCDWTGPTNKTAWLQLAFNFFDMVGGAPNSAAWSKEHGKYRDVKAASLPRMFAEKNVRGAVIQELLPPFADTNQWRTYAAFSETDGRKRDAIFSHASDVLDAELFATIALKFSEVAESPYGYGYLRPFELGPVMYAYDLDYGLDRSRATDAAEIDGMMRWRMERLDLLAQNKPAPFRHLLGMQRDVFAFNLLGPRHLERVIRGVSLSAWISDSANRGELKQISKNAWVWLVPPISLPFVRRSLAVEGILIGRVG